MATIWTHVGKVQKPGVVWDLFLSAKGTLRLCSGGGVIDNMAMEGGTQIHRQPYMKYLWFQMAGRMDLAKEIFPTGEDANAYLTNKYS